MDRVRKLSPPRVLHKIEHSRAMEITDRKREILQRLADGETPMRIAETLGIKLRTVKSHLRQSQEILSARTRAQMVARALAFGYIHLSTEVRWETDTTA